MSKIKLVSILALFIGLVSCQEFMSWEDDYGNATPDPVTITSVAAIHGGAVIKFKIPVQENLLGVKAVYKFSDQGETKEVFVSAFTDSIKIQGFPTENKYEVQLFTIHKNMKESAPVVASFNPLEPSIFPISKTVQSAPTFGGVYTKWQNPSEAEVAITLWKKNAENDDYTLYYTVYTKAPEGSFAFRGLKNENTTFKYSIRDRWLNTVETEPFEVTPLFEEEIISKDPTGKYLWTRLGISDNTVFDRGDLLYGTNFNWLFDGILWDPNAYFNTGNVVSGFQSFIPDWPNNIDYGAPQYMTFDLGRSQKLSRAKIWQRDRQPTFALLIPATMEIWASNTLPTKEEIGGNGSRYTNLMYWTDWPELSGTGNWRKHFTKIADFKQILPSGTDLLAISRDIGLLTVEDKAYLKAGVDIVFNEENSQNQYRYVRFVFGKMADDVPCKQIMWCEIKMFGSYKVD